MTALQGSTKRAIDLVGATAGLVMFAPFLLLIALAVKSALGSPVLFRQVRPGLHGRPFELLKFRTMTDLRDAAGELCPDGQRLTRFGRWLRSTSLDELPELINVLRGEMSLVGPRPLLLDYLPHYSVEQARRHEVRPGITGWAAIHGRNATSWERRLALDVWYVDHWSLGLDLKILLVTVVKVLKREGISPAGHATMPRFDTGAAARPDPVPTIAAWSGDRAARLYLRSRTRGR
jgi:lipopolysaccharide/colanic/teichoic acid biosynthesis glycosyltransferase